MSLENIHLDPRRIQIHPRKEERKLCMFRDDAKRQVTAFNTHGAP